MKKHQKGFIVPLLILIIVILIGVRIYYFYQKSDSPSGPTNQALQQTYKILVTKPDWTNKLITSNNPESWNVPSKSIEIKIVDTQNNFYCGNNKANFIAYSTHDNASNSVGGYWNTVSVVDCGTYYFVYETGDSGQKLYGPFELNNTATVSPNITVLSPNRGEVWKIGQTYVITTASKGDLGTRTVRLNRYSDDGVRVGNVTIGTTETDSFSYKIPAGTEETRGDATRYKIQVIVDKYNTGRGVADESDNYFSIIR